MEVVSDIINNYRVSKSIPFQLQFIQREIMRHIPAIKSVMTPFPYSVDINESIQYAEEFLQQHELGHLPVTNNKELAGVISHRDIRVFLLQHNNDKKKKVCDIPMGHKYVVDLNDRLDLVLDKMAAKHLDSALVTRQGKLVGIFTLSDVCRSFARYLTEQFGPPHGDEAA
ncbi:MAG: acetoin utilization protein AcuB [Planctomycetota bacterium]